MGAAELIIVALLLLGGGGAAVAATRKETKATAADDGAKLVARATQKAAHEWIGIFMNAGAPQGLAEALSRWAGIESSGNPLARSSLGERGLLQITEQSALKEKPPALNYGEWAQLSDPATPTEVQAKLAMQIASWCWLRAKRYVADPPTDYISTVWYAKLYHQRPVDVRDGKMHGPALPMARELATRWASDAAKMHRLRAANVVAWGQADPRMKGEA